MTNKNKILNIVFSTTRNWNPGDEIILRGVRNILDDLGIVYNPIIYNRHPDIRSEADQFFRFSKVLEGYSSLDEVKILANNIKYGMYDNSIKTDKNLEYVDFVIFAGTPEWCSSRLVDLYQLILRYNIPSIFVGIGGNYSYNNSKVKVVLEKAKLITVRDNIAFNSLREAGISAKHMPCPSILFTRQNYERTINKVKRLALIYQATVEETVVSNGGSIKLYKYEMSLYKEIINQFRNEIDITIVCHYVDEIYLAKKDFPECEVIYSYDGDDYIKIYSKFDMVIGPRVHGIGAAASMLIPGVVIIHDSRGETCEGFLAEKLNVDMSLNQSMRVIENVIDNISEMNQNLFKHKRKTETEYRKLLTDALNNEKVFYKERNKDVFIKKDYLSMIANDTQIMNAFEKIRIIVSRQIVDDVIKNQLKGKKIAIKGAGVIASLMIKYIIFLDADIDIQCIVDKYNVGESLMGYQIIPDDDIIKYNINTVLISSYRYRDDMKSDIFSLNKNYEIIDFYDILFDTGITLNDEFVKKIFTI